MSKTENEVIEETTVEETTVEEPKEAEVVEAAEEEPVAPEEGRNSRGEKKAKKVLSKIKMTPVDDVTRVSVRTGNEVFVINRPDVFEVDSTTSAKTYVVYGVARSSDITREQLMESAKRYMEANGGDLSDMGGEAVENTEAAAVETESKEGEAAGESVESASETNIELVLSQVEGKTREEAIAALNKSNGDIVSAIMELSA